MRKTGAVLLVVFFSLSILPLWVGSVSTNVVISEFRVRGPSGGSDEFVEIYNLSTSPVNIGGWTMRGSNNAGTASIRATIPTGVTLNSGCHYLFTNSSTSGGPYSGAVPGNQTYGTGITDDGGIGIALPNGTIVDQVGMSAGSLYKEGTTLASLGSSNLNRGYERKPGGSSGSGTDTDNNAADFQLITPSDPQNLSSTCINITSGNPTGVGAASPSSAAPGESTLLTVAVTPGTNPTSTGLAVAADLTSIGGAASQSFFDDGTHGDVTAGDKTFSYLATVSAGATPGAKSLPVTITDAENRSGSTTIDFTVLAPLVAIHDIQGSGTTSPYAGQPVRTTGIVTARRFNNGFFIQTPDADVDADPNTSEGIFVFTSSAPPAAAAVGNSVMVSGTVSEFIPSADPFSPPLTEIGGSPTVTLLSTGNTLPAAIALMTADTSPAGSIEQLERYEGMRASADSLIVVGPTAGFISEPNATATSNGVFYAVLTGIARPFREPGIHTLDPLPPGSPCCVPRWDGNPERLRVDSDGQVGATALNVAAGSVLTNVVGVLDFAFRTYTILPDPGAGISVTPPADPESLPVPGKNEFTVGTFNLNRFFDTANDPLTSDPVLTAVAFDRRLSKASLAIREEMQSPDIIGVEEVENLSTLQALANRLNSDTVAAGGSDPAYEAFLEEGNDVGGIDVGLLVKTSRVLVIDVTQEGKDATFINPNTNTADLLNDRPPLVLRATILSMIGPNLPVTVIANHLRSLLDIDNPTDGARVRAKRNAQAEFLADLIQTRQLAEPDEPIVVVGDFNAFEFSDGYVDVMGTIKGTPTPADQVVLAGADLVDPDLTDLLDTLPADERYSFVFDGSAQTLDHILVTENLLPRLSGLHIPHIDADFPETSRNDGTQPNRLSDHDPMVAYFFLPPITVTIDIKPGEFPNSINLGSKGTVPVAILSTESFDATTIDPTTLTLAGAAVKLRGRGTPMASFQDVNGDGLLDLVVHVLTDSLQLSEGETEAVLEAMTFDMKRVRGTDTVRIVP